MIKIISSVLLLSFKYMLAMSSFLASLYIYIYFETYNKFFFSFLLRMFLYPGTIF